MRKSTRRVALISLVIVFLIGGIIFVKISLSNKGGLETGALSPDQQKVVEIVGYPQQFVITYTPRESGKEPELVRNEVWYYSNNKKEVTFIGGKLAGSKNYEPDKTPATTTLRPENFTFGQNLAGVSSILGTKNVSEVTDLPGFEPELDIKVYVSPQAMFLIENGYLTYFQTLGTGGDILQESD